MDEPKSHISDVNRENWQFNEALRVAINRNSIDTKVGVPDFILADILTAVTFNQKLIAYLTKDLKRDNWPVPPKTAINTTGE